jgi:hypothetical protein
VEFVVGHQSVHAAMRAHRPRKEVFFKFPADASIGNLLILSSKEETWGRGRFGARMKNPHHPCRVRVKIQILTFREKYDIPTGQAKKPPNNRLAVQFVND